MEIESVHDDATQRAALEVLQAAHPGHVLAAGFGRSETDNAFVGLMQYLHQHGLADVQWQRSAFLPAPIFVHATITARGLDFLREDGGLTAKLGVVTVKLDEATLRALIAQRIDHAPLPPEQKDGLREWLRSASKEALSAAIQRLVDAALDRLPDALQLLRMPLG